MFIALNFLSSRGSEKLTPPSHFSRQDASKHVFGDLQKSNWKFDPGQGQKSENGVKFSSELFKVTRYIFRRVLTRKIRWCFCYFRSYVRLTFSSKLTIFLFQVPWNLIIYLIHLKSQHTVLRAICGLSGTFFVFALAVIGFEILPIFLAEWHVFGKNGSFKWKPRGLKLF